MNTLIKVIFFLVLLVPSVLYSNEELYKVKNLYSFVEENIENGNYSGYLFFKKRYYDPRINIWISTDPYLSNGKYFPKPQDFDTEHDYLWRSVHDESEKLPGMGGLFNYLNLNVYGYAGQNPVKYVDPDGEFFVIPLFLVLTATIVLTERYVDTDTTADYGKRVTENVALKGFDKFGNGFKIGKAIYSNANNKQNQMSKDAKKISNNNEANKFAKEMGYKDAHDFKKQNLKGQRDKTEAHYNIFENKKTGEAFLKNNDGKTVIKIK